VKPRRLSDVADAVHGLFLGEDVEVTSLATDSREVEPGGLFVAIPGTRVDGHRFVPEAFERGAAGVLVRDGFRVDGPAVTVRSTTEALMQLAADERDRIDAAVIAITGANGKTSTKDFAAAVCSSTLRTHASPESFNNELGLPLTLLGAPADTQVIVAEMGARRPGDVARLCDVARPRVAVVTNVGVAHIEVFGSWEAIVEASAEPVVWLRDDGVAVLNADDPVVAGFADRCRAKVVTFGQHASAQVRAELVSVDREGRASLDIVHELDRARVRLPIPGDHMVPNALAAVAVGLEVGVPFEPAVAALADAEMSRWRMETFVNADGVRIVNDAYNANPESVEAALRTARWMAGEGRLVAVLGTMAELGELTHEAHERIGELAARLRVDRLITVGEGGRAIAMAGVREGVEPDRVASYPDVEGAIADVRASVAAGDVVLCKASRVARLERVAEALR
jgi:UDP-N-acetylmuramoyl-tripeptide--D-alanyl-D-alanine ligase